MEAEEVKRKTVRGTIVLTGRTVFLQLISAIAFFLLGIFLAPATIGVYIIVSSVLRLFTLFTDVGLSAALIQKRDEPDINDLRTAFTVSEMLVVPIVIIGWLLSPIVAKYTGFDSQGIFLYQVLVFTLFISSLKVIPSVLLERKLAFEIQVLPQIVETLVFNLIVVFLAFKGFGVASFSWAVLVSALAGLPIYYLVSPWKVGLGVTLSKVKSLFSYGLAFQGKTVLAVLKDDLLTFVLSGMVGASGVGFWGWAQRWSYFPFRFIVDSVTKVTFPAYSRIQSQREILGGAIEKSLFVVSLTLFPILTIMMVMIPKLIYLVPRYVKWEPAIASFIFLCLAAALSSLSNILVNALDATGRVKTTLGLMVAWVILTWALTMALVTRQGFTGIAVASFGVSLTVFITAYIVKKQIKFSFWGSFYQAFLSCLVMGAAMWFLSSALPLNYLNLGITAMMGVIIYTGIMLILVGEKLHSNFRLIWGSLKR